MRINLNNIGRHAADISAKGDERMAIKIVRLGSGRERDEGLRLGTVRRPPRGVPKDEYASRDFYDVWLPNLSPSVDLLQEAKTAEEDKAWLAFKRKFRAEMNSSEPSKILDLLAAFSHQINMSLGCYCEDEARCHRSVLRELLVERGVEVY